VPLGEFDPLMGGLAIVRPLLVKIGDVYDGARSERVLSWDWETQVHLAWCTTGGVLVIGEGLWPVATSVVLLPTCVYTLAPGGLASRTTRSSPL